MQDSATTLQGITDINAGGSSTCLVESSKLMCFGMNNYYSLGIANYYESDVLYPTELGVTLFPSGVEVVSTIHVNNYNGYAVMSSDNSIYCCGKKDKHGLGQGDATIDGNVGDVIPLTPSRTIN